jgi:hypothetical protein
MRGRFRICAYMPRTCVSNPSRSLPLIILVAPERCSGGTPSTTSIAAVPRIRSCLASPGVAPVSIVSATSGRSARASTFGALGAVQMTTRSPSQKNPIGIARGRPSRPA